MPGAEEEAQGGDAHAGPEDEMQRHRAVIEQRLARRGLLVFTTCGYTVAAKLRAGEDLGISPDQTEGMLAEFDQSGFSYRDYPSTMLDEMSWPSGSYGLTLSSPAWVCAQLGERLLRQMQLHLD